MKHELSKERLTQIIRAIECEAFDEEEILKSVSSDELLSLACYRLAAHEQEQVEWRNGCNQTVPAALRYLAEHPRPIGGESRYNTAHLYQLAREIELTAAHPAPSIPAAVPDERDAFEVWALTQVHTTKEFLAGIRTTGGYWDETGTGAEANRLWRIWCSIRAAMLQSEPEGWIPVSERMPDKLIPVMVMYEDGDMWSAIWSGQFWDDGCAIPDPHSITHWRDMPAAPKVTP